MIKLNKFPELQGFSNGDKIEINGIKYILEGICLYNEDDPNPALSLVSMDGKEYFIFLHRENGGLVNCYCPEEEIIIK